jgi:hypothetical protein
MIEGGRGGGGEKGLEEVGMEGGNCHFAYM